MADLHPKYDEEARAYLDLVIAEALAQEAFAVVLTGSSARGAEPGIWSDVDLLAIDLSPGDSPPSVHLIEVKVADFEAQLISGDDVAQWAARYGKPLYGGAQWEALVASLLPAAPWPDFRKKLYQSTRRLDVSRVLLDAGDARSAQKELVYAASHLARALLFARRVFPLSRPELPAQLGEINEHEIAAAIQKLASTLVKDETDLGEIWLLIQQRGRALSSAPIAAAG